VTRSFNSYDGTVLAYRRIGAGDPLVCLPGGPGRDAGYLGDLGGLAQRAGYELIIFEPRGSGASAVPVDPATYRADRMVEDVEALRVHPPGSPLRCPASWPRRNASPASRAAQE
jgi:proline iminopeptidase